MLSPSHPTEAFAQPALVPTGAALPTLSRPQTPGTPGGNSQVDSPTIHHEFYRLIGITEVGRNNIKTLPTVPPKSPSQDSGFNSFSSGCTGTTISTATDATVPDDISEVRRVQVQAVTTTIEGAVPEHRLHPEPIQKYSPILPQDVYEKHPPGPLNWKDGNIVYGWWDKIEVPVDSKFPPPPPPTLKEKIRNKIDSFELFIGTKTEQEVREDIRYRKNRAKNRAIRKEQEEKMRKMQKQMTQQNNGAKMPGGDAGTGNAVRPIKAFRDMLEKEEREKEEQDAAKRGITVELVRMEKEASQRGVPLHVVQTEKEAQREGEPGPSNYAEQHAAIMAGIDIRVTTPDTIACSSKAASVRVVAGAAAIHC